MQKKVIGGRRSRIVFHAIVLAIALFYGLMACLGLPAPQTAWISSFYIKTILSLVLAYGLLIFFMIRVCSIKIRKWEAVLYSALMVFCIIVITIMFVYLANEIEIMFQNHNPYDVKTEKEQHYAYYEEYEYLGLEAAFRGIMFGGFNIFITIVFAIISITLACIKNNNKAHETQSVKVEMGAETNKENTRKIVQKEGSYCIYCGNKVDRAAKFCKYCGKQIK